MTRCNIKLVILFLGTGGGSGSADVKNIGRDDNDFSYITHAFIIYGFHNSTVRLKTRDYSKIFT